MQVLCLGAGEYVPMAQSWHGVVGSESWSDVPTLQLVHAADVLAPVTTVKVPTGQSLHVVLPGACEYLPAEQIAQYVPWPVSGGNASARHSGVVLQEQHNHELPKENEPLLLTSPFKGPPPIV